MRVRVWAPRGAHRQQRLARARWAIQDDALGLRDAQRIKELWVLNGQLHHLFDLFDLLVQPTHHVIRAVRHLLHLHQAHQRVNLGRQLHVQRVRVVAQRNSCRWLDRGDVDGLVALYHVLSFRVHLRSAWSVSTRRRHP
jgi:hypothetical protein